ESDCPHEAAFDAFICGAVLLQLAKLLLINQGSVFEPRIPLIGEYLTAVEPYKNNVNLIRARVSFMVSPWWVREIWSLSPHRRVEPTLQFTESSC
ncbi:hypothetical protein scyTo_0023587, partial [Scyliorhinus torazame]|nr:hypothetical protein [Scyliorhinus torazame]